VITHSQFLDSVEANHHAILYECRWNPSTAAIVVPQLITALGDPDRTVVIRTLGALYRIGLPAEEATPSVIRLVVHSDSVIARAAIMAVAAVGRKMASEAVPALIAASAEREYLKETMFALIAFGPQAREATRVFTSALENGDHRIRKLAIRGLEAVADDMTLKVALELAIKDKAKAVREYAHRVSSRTAKEDITRKS
jgi:HEAT repeat protein